MTTDDAMTLAYQIKEKEKNTHNNYKLKMDRDIGKIGSVQRQFTKRLKGFISRLD